MIVYADTSALVQLIVQEPGCKDMLGLRRPQITVLATARIAYVEVRAALAVMHRTNRLAPARYRQAKRPLESVWQSTSPIEIDADLLARAGDLAERRALRGYDAVHLAALERLASPSQCVLAPLGWSPPACRKVTQVPALPSAGVTSKPIGRHWPVPPTAGIALRVPGEGGEGSR